MTDHVLIGSHIRRIARRLMGYRRSRYGVDLCDLEQAAWVAALSTPDVTQLRLHGAMVDCYRTCGPFKRQRRNGIVVRDMDFDVTLQEPHAAADVPADRQVLYGELHAAIAQLGPVDQATLRARFWDETPHQTLADQEGLTQQAIWHRQRTALGHLKGLLT